MHEHLHIYLKEFNFASMVWLLHASTLGSNMLVTEKARGKANTYTKTRITVCWFAVFHDVLVSNYLCLQWGSVSAESHEFIPLLSLQRHYLNPYPASGLSAEPLCKLTLFWACYLVSEVVTIFGFALCNCFHVLGQLWCREWALWLKGQSFNSTEQFIEGVCSVP